MDTKSSASDQAPTPDGVKYYYRIMYLRGGNFCVRDINLPHQLDTRARLGAVEDELSPPGESDARIINIIPLKG